VKSQRPSPSGESLTVGDGRGHAFPQGEGVTTHEVRAGHKRVVKGVEEVGGRGGEQVADVLLKRVDVLTGRLLGHETVVINSVDILLLGHLQTVIDISIPCSKCISPTLLFCSGTTQSPNPPDTFANPKSVLP
jgi:hypothetical protein